MDPNATLAELRQMLKEYLDDIELTGGVIQEEAATRIAERFLALDEWIVKGGFLPAAWQGVVNDLADSLEKTTEELRRMTLHADEMERAVARAVLAAPLPKEG